MQDELLLLVFLHGFKGGADTFDHFPERVAHILSQAQPRVDVQPVVYPPYDTRGELLQAVDNHIAWLTTLVAERKEAFKQKGGNGPTNVVLLGHSMGGLVIADTVLATLTSDSLPILGVIAYDSPFLGLHPAVFKNTFDKAIGYASQGQAVLAALGVGYGLLSGSSKSGSTTPPTAPMSSTSASTSKTKETTVANSDKPAAKSSWLSLSTMASLAAAAGAVGAAGAAYYNRDAISAHVNWATSHLSFIGELWKTTELEKRIEELVHASEQGVGFHCFYTSLPPSAAATSRTFCLLPHSTSTLRPCFSPNTNSHASDEITAHIEMFTEKSDGMYELGQKTCSLLGRWLEAARRGEMGPAQARKLGKEKDQGKKNGERIV